MKSTILIKDIAQHYLTIFDNTEYKNNTEIFQFMTNYINDFLNLKDVNSAFSEIESQQSNIMKYFNYLKVNCLILWNFICRSIAFYRKYKAVEWKNKYEKEEKIMNINVKFTFKEEKSQDNAINTFNDSLIALEKDVISTLQGDEVKTYENKEPIIINYKFDEDLKDYFYTYNSYFLEPFINYQLDMANRFVEFILQSYNTYNSLNRKMIANKELSDYEYCYIVFFSN